MKEVMKYRYRWIILFKLYTGVKMLCLQMDIKSLQDRGLFGSNSNDAIIEGYKNSTNLR